MLTDDPPHPALRATFSHGGEKGSRWRRGEGAHREFTHLSLL
jgi:hypothetical protein